MNIKAIIFGSTGMVGQAVLLECIADDSVSSVLVVNRKRSNVRHEKVKEIVHGDFSDFSSLVGEFSGYNTCFYCLGISSVGLSEDEYKRITYGITVNVANALLRTGKEFTFCFVSGAGTDSSEKGKTMWARIKGKAENALLAMPFKDAYMFRPGYIQPMKGIKSRTTLYRVLYKVFWPVYYLLKPFKGAATNTTLLGKAMINAAKNGYPKKIITNADINELAKSTRQ